MCGIFAYVGKQRNAANIIFSGLKRLEYRGYDSWGIAVCVKGKIVIEKRVGKIGEAKVDLPESSLGIGHTRWATHGGVTVENAHPLLDCSAKIAVVHNGIVENFQELKEELLKNGHKFASETDTEVIPHLIEEFAKTKEFPEAVREAFNKLSGLNAVVATNCDSSQIVAAKNGSPLVIGIGDGELFIASDAIGILAHTKKVVFIEDGQIAILGKEIELISLKDGSTLESKIVELDWKFEESELGDFKHFFLKEIYEQPKVIENIAATYAVEIEKFADLIDKSHGIFFVACGSASYAALAGTYLFSTISKKHVNFAIGSEFNYLEDYIDDGTLVIPISQSGESIDVVEPVLRAKRKGATIAAILNVQGSTLYREADYKILLGCGSERAVVATKSLIAMVSILILLSYTLAKKQKAGQEMLVGAAKNVRALLSDESINKIKELARQLSKTEHLFVIGRGLSYPTALEATLKLKEASYTHAEGFAGGELKHGPIALISEGSPCIVFAPNDETYEAIVSNAAEVKARGALIIGVGPKKNEVFDQFLETDDLAEATMIPQIVYSQLLSYYLALEKGVENPDMPRNLAKSVTVR